MLWVDSPISSGFGLDPRYPRVFDKRIPRELRSSLEREIIENLVKLDAVERDFIKSSEWKRVRNHYLKEEQCCRVCGITVTLTVDHILPRRWFPELALHRKNLQVLCRQCNALKGEKICFPGELPRPCSRDFISSLTVLPREKIVAVAKKIGVYEAIRNHPNLGWWPEGQFRHKFFGCFPEAFRLVDPTFLQQEPDELGQCGELCIGALLLLSDRAQSIESKEELKLLLRSKDENFGKGQRRLSQLKSVAVNVGLKTRRRKLNELGDIDLRYMSNDYKGYFAGNRVWLVRLRWREQSSYDEKIQMYFEDEFHYALILDSKDDVLTLWEPSFARGAPDRQNKSPFFQLRRSEIFRRNGLIDLKADRGWGLEFSFGVRKEKKYISRC